MVVIQLKLHVCLNQQFLRSTCKPAGKQRRFLANDTSEYGSETYTVQIQAWQREGGVI
jgi:hypothetical protein